MEIYIHYITPDELLSIMLSKTYDSKIAHKRIGVWTHQNKFYDNQLIFILGNNNQVTHIRIKFSDIYSTLKIVLLTYIQ